MAGLSQPDTAEILQHYQLASEADRLGKRGTALEFVRTCEIMQRHLPAAPAVVYDVGGGAGVYAFWLAARGYTVHLLDIVPKHIEQAREFMASAPKPPAAAQVGDARRLPYGDASAQALLLLGPLYHLTERAERLLALREACRVLRPGGILFAAAICRFASLMDSLSRGFFADPEFAPILERDLREGQHRNPTGQLEYFTTAYFHRPEELQAEVSEAGFSGGEIVAVEGPGWLGRQFDENWKDSHWQEQLLGLLRRVEREPALMGISQHLLAVARKAGE